MKLTTHLRPVPTSIMHADIPPLPNTHSLRGAQLKKHRNDFIFYLIR